jgi:hypothetical protein
VIKQKARPDSEKRKYTGLKSGNIVTKLYGAQKAKIARGIVQYFHLFFVIWLKSSL